MTTIKPFPAFRPSKEKARFVAALPYDVLSTEEARDEADDNPDTFLHVTKPEIDLPPGTDPYSPKVYKKGKENFDKMVASGVMVQDKHPHLYIYRQKMKEWVQTGLVCCSSVRDYWDDVIKKHELTRPVKEQDRVDHMKALGMHPEPVFLTYPAVEDIDAIIAGISSGQAPEYDFMTDDKVSHTLWVVSDDEVIRALLNLFATRVKNTYIADGHHRAASSARVGKEMAAVNPKHTGDEEYNCFLTVLFPSGQVHILDYNRLIRGLHGRSVEELTEALEEDFEVSPSTKAVKPKQLHEFGMYAGGSWYRLKARQHTYNELDPAGVLDVSIVTKYILDEWFDIEDQRTDGRVEFVGGIRGMKELERRVDSGEFEVAVSVFPVSVDQLFAVADSGNIMPPKSTWFEPKLRSGLFVHLF